MSITRVEILAILDSIPRIPEKHKQRVSWELLHTFNQLKLWQEEAMENDLVNRESKRKLKKLE